MPVWLVLTLLAFGVSALVCFIAGLARARFKLAPLMAAAAIVASYVILVSSVWLWARPSCFSGCSEDEFGRAFAVGLAIFYPGLFALIDIAIIWLGAWTSTIFWKQQSPLRLSLTRGRVAIGLFIAVFAVLSLVYG